MYNCLFLGKSQDSWEKIKACYDEINSSEDFELRVDFKVGEKDKWQKYLSSDEKTLVYYEITEPTARVEKNIINQIQDYNSNLEWVILTDSSIDYFEIAQTYKIGNILKKDQYDSSIIRALSIRLLTGELFGFAPYFPDGFTRKPISWVVEGEVVTQDVMSRFEAEFLRDIPENEQYRLRTYFYELLVNAISYTIVGISSEERDEGVHNMPSKITVPSGQALKISMVLDEEKSGFSIMDNSGSLTLERILQKLRRQFAIGEEERPPGIWDLTGRGLSLILKDNRLIINILRNQITEIIFLHYNNSDCNKYESIIIADVTSAKSLPAD